MQRTHLDADGESAVAHNLNGPLHLQRPDVPICNLARRGATTLYGLCGTHDPPVVGSSPAARRGVSGMAVSEQIVGADRVQRLTV